jgi:hypothetical protein
LPVPYPCPYPPIISGDAMGEKFHCNAGKIRFML